MEPSGLFFAQAGWQITFAYSLGKTFSRVQEFATSNS